MDKALLEFSDSTVAEITTAAEVESGMQELQLAYMGGGLADVCLL